MKEITSPLPGYKVKNVYTLKPAEVERITEIRAIRKSAQERLHSMGQKVLDCTRIIDGMMTEIKWNEGWQDGDVVVYDPEVRAMLCLEAEGN